MIWNERRWGNPLPQDYASRLARADDTVNLLAGKLERAKADRAKMIENEARIDRFRESVEVAEFIKKFRAGTLESSCKCRRCN